MPESQRQQLTVQISNATHESLVSILIPLALFENATTENEVNALLREKAELWDNERINRQLNNPDSAGELDSMDQLSLDFHRIFEGDRKVTLVRLAYCLFHEGLPQLISMGHVWRQPQRSMLDF